MPTLTPGALAAEWKKDVFRPAYYFFGEDTGSKRNAVTKLRETLKSDDFNTSEFSGEADEQAEDIASTCLTPPMFSPRRLVIVRDMRMGAHGRKRLADYLRSPLETTTLVMLSGERKPAAKDVLAAGISSVGGVVLFDPLSESSAITRLRENARRAGFELEPDAAELLVEESGSSWGILRSELNKIRLFVQGRETASIADVAACLGYRQQTNIFELPNGVEKRDAKKALRALRGLLREGQNPFSLLYKIKQPLLKQMKAKRMQRAGATQNQISGSLRVHRSYVDIFLKNVSQLSEPGLIRSLRHCLDTEAALKSKAWLDPAIELQNLVLKICGKA